MRPAHDALCRLISRRYEIIGAWKFYTAGKWLLNSRVAYYLQWLLFFDVFFFYISTYNHLFPKTHCFMWKNVLKAIRITMSSIYEKTIWFRFYFFGQINWLSPDLHWNLGFRYGLTDTNKYCNFITNPSLLWYYIALLFAQHLLLLALCVFFFQNSTLHTISFTFACYGTMIRMEMFKPISNCLLSKSKLTYAVSIWQKSEESVDGQNVE